MCFSFLLLSLKCLETKVKYIIWCYCKWYFCVETCLVKIKNQTKIVGNWMFCLKLNRFSITMRLGWKHIDAIRMCSSIKYRHIKTSQNLFFVYISQISSRPYGDTFNGYQNEFQKAKQKKESTKLTAEDALSIFTSMPAECFPIRSRLFILVSLVACSLCPLQLLLQ